MNCRPTAASSPARLSLLAALCLTAARLPAQGLDQLSLERWAELTETQRYQLQIAEKYFREKNYKVAAAEYEKYLTLYEQSEAAAYSQLKWSLAMARLRQSNTAISDGFQSVVDYWPDSPEAVAAAYYIGSTYRGMGRVSQAKAALRKVIDNHAGHLAAVRATSELIEIAAQEQDDKLRTELLRKLTFDTPRNKHTERACLDASRSLATQMFSQAALQEGVAALATSYQEGLPRDDQVAALLLPQLAALASREQAQAQAAELAAAAADYFRQQAPPADDEQSRRAALQYGFHVAAVQAAAGQDEQAPQTYEKLFRQFGPDDEILRRLAEFHKSRKNFDEARAAYRRYDDKAAGLAEAAYSYRQQGQIDPAIAIYDQLASSDADNALKWQAEAAATYRGARQYQQAIDAYEALMAADVESAEKWRWQIATAYRDWGKYPEAIGHFRQCTNFPENYKQMAWCQRKLDKPQEAVILYNQVMAHEPSAPWALLQIGYTREEAGQSEQAIKTFQLVCKRFPKDRYASTAHAHLQNKYKISVTLGGATDE